MVVQALCTSGIAFVPEAACGSMQVLAKFDAFKVDGLASPSQHSSCCMYERDWKMGGLSSVYVAGSADVTVILESVGVRTETAYCPKT